MRAALLCVHAVRTVPGAHALRLVRGLNPTTRILYTGKCAAKVGRVDVRARPCSAYTRCAQCQEHRCTSFVASKSNEQKILEKFFFVILVTEENPRIRSQIPSQIPDPLAIGADPDPDQNVTDPQQHFLVGRFVPSCQKRTCAPIQSSNLLKMLLHVTYYSKQMLTGLQNLIIRNPSDIM
jgi:hypothetical protein